MDRMMTTSLGQKTRSNFELGIRSVLQDVRLSLAEGHEKVGATVAGLKVRILPNPEGGRR